MPSANTSLPTPSSPAVEAAPPAAPAPLPHVVQVADGALTVAARDGVTVASEHDSLVLTAAREIVLSVGRSTLTLRADGTVLLNGQRMTLLAPDGIALNPGLGHAPPSPAAGPCHGCGDGAPGTPGASGTPAASDDPVP